LKQIKCIKEDRGHINIFTVTTQWRIQDFLEGITLGTRQELTGEFHACAN